MENYSFEEWETGSSSESSIPPVYENVGTPAVEELIAPVAPSPPAAGDREFQEEAKLHARGYQLEMLEASLNQNIIVAMDTGSGKTQVAVLRIQAELARSLPGKIVWFLAPTVALCYQQFNVVSSQISGATKMLSGNDGPEAWSSAQVWNAFLANVSVVVSTPEVLSQALLHGFVTMEILSLIVLDEAHNCVGNNPGSKVMSHYRKAKKAGLHIPAILGLTASPVMKTSEDSLERIEATLDAVCKTPITHRAELLAQVNRPEMILVPYDPVSDPVAFTTTHAMKSLQDVRNAMNIRHDPYIQQKKLEIQSGIHVDRSREELRGAVQKDTTPSIKQIRSLCRRTKTIRCELGTWAADYYIQFAITEFLNSVNNNDIILAAWTLAEKQYLANILRRVQLPQVDRTGDLPVTHKVTMLIEQLLACPTNALGIIFVEETATVTVLHALLSSHPLTRIRYRIGTMVGLSRSASRKGEIGEVNREDSLLNLKDFREGKINLLIATNVLEEGIDVPACNLVVCFDKPSNLKSFIQRRGRAREKNSKLILLHENGPNTQMTWEDLEEEMKKKYEAEGRENWKLNQLEESKDDYFPTFSTTTGNQMDIEHAKGHLEHLCNTLFSKQYVECRPYYLFSRQYTTRTKSEPPLIRATVVLPNSLPPHLRRIDGACSWYSEKKACKDAAFEAYRMLYDEGFVNEHLLPFKGEELIQSPEIRLPEEEVRERWNPWPRIARLCGVTERVRNTVSLADNGRLLCKFDLSLPIAIPAIPPFQVFWNDEPWVVEIQPGTYSTGTTSDPLVEINDLPRRGRDSSEESSNIFSGRPSDSPKDTMALLALAMGHRRLNIREEAQHVLHFHSKSGPIAASQSTLTLPHGSRPFTPELNDVERLSYLVRNTANGAPYFFDQWLPSQPSDNLVSRKLSSYYRKVLEEESTEGPWLALRNWPRRRDFLHRSRAVSSTQKASDKPYQTAWPVSCCRMDSTLAINVQFGALIPSIIHMIDIYLVTQELSETVLKELRFRDLSLLLAAISASSAREAENYQRLEFLGDVILKLLSTISVAVNYPQFPEGYLSKMRARIVSNSRLCRSTKETGIDKFIITKAFSGDKWQPLYADETALLEEVAGNRKLGTKVLADIVESLTGASYQDGGTDKSGMLKSLQCLRLLIPDNRWHTLEEGRHLLLLSKEHRDCLPTNLVAMEELLGYSFTYKNLLVEAVTHASYNMNLSSDRTYERLEFIGDAILDYIIIQKLWERNLSQSMMTTLRAACVNADLLGFFGMEWSLPQTTVNVVDGQPVSTTVRFPFWKFMRHTSPEIGALQKATEERHALEREAILEAIWRSPTFPWALLAHLHVPKFFSDIFESVIGAVWLDSGNLDCCRAIVERIGIMPYLERVLDQNVDVIHPKNKLGVLAVEKTVKYEVSREEDDMTRIRCKVYVGGEMVVEVGDGLYNDEIITRAAERAYDVLRRRNRREADGDAMEVDE
ncbi:hypothetical protein BKA67DRAFT_532030 [Truncatella angustata]|uniref:Dicer-like protein 2 n=1 Tax=Truncatella angustata TaxID=152316 RepID=A0A9P9A008_9PEZI|nr:uncharacterized protein BKA67DRAFT_532030 [Truncatella angustata]KAH6656778.1 hypothetical protein BKA67DRAFT_532030 [Truncatella angustata]KAH8197898.1 hypothetical protein TruAng_007950 [Truncatella angustata]